MIRRATADCGTEPPRSRVVALSSRRRFVRSRPCAPRRGTRSSARPRSRSPRCASRRRRRASRRAVACATRPPRAASTRRRRRCRRTTTKTGAAPSLAAESRSVAAAAARRGGGGSRCTTPRAPRGILTVTRRYEGARSFTVHNAISVIVARVRSRTVCAMPMCFAARVASSHPPHQPASGRFVARVNLFSSSLNHREVLLRGRRRQLEQDGGAASRAVCFPTPARGGGRCLCGGQPV